ncbi:MAG: FmdE family protein [Conexivisphaerales archaeon]|jgi:formylmethanofuran dehydrogenase subunit E
MSANHGGSDFEELLAKASALRGHLCLGLPLGIKMADTGLHLLGMEDARRRGDLVVFVESNRCAVDAVQVVTGCSMGSRRLKVFDYGKLAATFLDRSSGKAVRVFARPQLTKLANEVAVREGLLKDGESAEVGSEVWRKVMMNAFLKMSADQIFDHQEVILRDGAALLRGPRIPRVHCASCGEEILDGKGVQREGRTVCLACDGQAYYRPIPGR